MQPRLHLVTLGVDDLERAKRFYRDGLGRKLAVEVGDFALVALGPVGLALHPRKLLAEDARLAVGGGFDGITLAQNVAEERDVQVILDQAVAAGGKLLKPATKADWGGTSGYFADPDGHAWEIAFNPMFPLGPDGQLVFPNGA